MANKPKFQHNMPSEDEKSDPLVITTSQLLAMTEDERNKFRHKGGTVTEDPS